MFIHEEGLSPRLTIDHLNITTREEKVTVGMTIESTEATNTQEVDHTEENMKLQNQDLAVPVAVELREVRVVVAALVLVLVAMEMLGISDTNLELSLANTE